MIPGRFCRMATGGRCRRRQGAGRSWVPTPWVLHVAAQDPRKSPTRKTDAWGTLVSVRRGVLRQWYPLIVGRSQEETANRARATRPGRSLRILRTEAAMKYRMDPFWLGFLVALVGFPIIFIVGLHYPSVGDLFGKNNVWLHFAVQTVIVFGLLIKYFRPSRRSLGFWGLLTGVFVLRMACLVPLILYVGPLNLSQYIVYGLVDLVVLVFLFQCGMLLLRIK